MDWKILSGFWFYGWFSTTLLSHFFRFLSGKKDIACWILKAFPKKSGQKSQNRSQQSFAPVFTLSYTAKKKYEKWSVKKLFKLYQTLSTDGGSSTCWTRVGRRVEPFTHRLCHWSQGLRWTDRPTRCLKQRPVRGGLPARCLQCSAVETRLGCVGPLSNVQVCSGC